MKDHGSTSIEEDAVWTIAYMQPAAYSVNTEIIQYGDVVSYEDLVTRDSKKKRTISNTCGKS